MRLEMNRLETSGLKLHMYPFVPPPFFFQVREAVHLATRLFLRRFNIYPRAYAIIIPT